MNRVFVRYLLWLLIAALPLQGVAAVKLCCGHERHMVTENSAHQAVSPASAAHQHHGLHDAHSSAQTHDHCKAPACCAACYAGAAVLPANPVFTPVLLNSAATALPPAPLVTGYIPGGLERPPRLFSA